MATVQNTNAPQTTYVTVTQKPKPNYNWATVQLNLIMLPVGLAILLTVSLTAVLCHCLRKRRFKKLARDLKNQQKSQTVYSVHSNGVSTLLNFSQSPVRYSPAGIHREDTPSTIHPAAVRKKKKKFQMHQSLDSNKKPEISEKKRRTSRRSITPVNERPRSREWHGNRKIPPERRVSKIPVPVKSRKKSRRANSVETVKSHYSYGRSSFEPNIAVIDREDPYKIDMDSVRSSKDRRKWEIPVAQSIEYDPQRGLRLPPLLEKRIVNSA